MTIVYLIRSILGPELFRVFRQGHVSGRNYHPNNLEYYSNTVISLFRGFYVFCKWTSPIILGLAYSRSYFSLRGLYILTHLSCWIGIIFIIAQIARGLGRFVNKEYRDFLEAFTKVTTQSSDAERKKFLLKYDFELKYWKPDFVCDSSHPKFTWNKTHILVHDSPVDTIKFFIWRILSAFCIDTFGLKMMYPGVVLQNLIRKPLQDCRTKLVEQLRAQRALIQTSCAYRNKIDTVFVDQRNTVRYSAPTSRVFTLNDQYTTNNSQEDAKNGKYLVICCDGNASFYENGIFQLPVESGYSALGWNYPGFGQSTGKPYPRQLTAAADAVMQYAFSLGFESQNIILFSWSIGGFAVSWLANHYPEVKAIVLDACFDDIIPLAQQQMPTFATHFVEYAIKHNLNLNVADMVKNYSGPIMFVRRTQDEIISTIPKVPSSNRGNDLLISTLKSRYPYIVNDDTIPFIRTWLSAKSDLDRSRILNAYSSSDCEKYLSDYVKKFKPSYPIQLGKENIENEGNKELHLSKDAKLSLSLYLANKYMINYESSHCQPLLKEHFQLPWSESCFI